MRCRDKEQRRRRGDSLIKPRGAAGLRLGPLCRKGVHFPCSMSILGPRAEVRRKVLGHRQLPSLSEDRLLDRRVHGGLGQRGPTAPQLLGERQALRQRKGRSQEPKEGVRQAVEHGLKSKKHFPLGGIAALEQRAPTIADFEAGVGHAQ